MPAIHAGMTNAAFSSFICERKLMDHFVVRLPFCATSLCFLNSEVPIVLIDDHVQVRSDGRRTEKDKVVLKEFLHPRFVLDAFSYGDSSGCVGDAGLAFFGQDPIYE